ncbi:PAS domain S-box protein [Methanoregula sp. UBA64]|uniref:PAS domain S-box protein n=1 Tax=Methanoregula sp. UBA64 TaxID=1915554 RepID=UPI0025E18DB7|nr:PAS domain S-box protein [Methanoregula sp. UBA64]
MAAETEVFSSITRLLSSHPEGLYIKEIWQALNISRNTVSKYLEILHKNGQVDIRILGKAKIFYLSKRTPFLVLAEISSDPVIGVNRNFACVAANTLFYKWVDCTPEEILGKPLGALAHPVVQSCFTAAPVDDNGFFIGDPGHSASTVKYRGSIYDIRYLPVIFADSSTGSAIVIKDITRDETAKARILHLEQEYRALAESQNEYVFHSLPSGIVTWANPAFGRLAGLSPEQITGRRFSINVPEEDRTAVQRHYASVSRDEPEKNLDCRVIPPSGELRWVRWTTRGIFPAEGPLAEYHTSGTDITELVDAREALRTYREKTDALLQERDEEFYGITDAFYRENQKRRDTERHLQRLQFTLNNTSEMILWLNKAGRIVSLNKPALDTLGLSPGSSLRFTRPGSGEPPVCLPWEEIRERSQQNGCHLFEAVVKDKNAYPLFVEVLCNYLYYDDTGSWCLFVRDMSDRDRAVRNLIQSKQKYLEVFCNVSDAIMVFSVDASRRFQVLCANPAAERLYNLSSAGLSGMFRDGTFQTAQQYYARSFFFRCLESGDPQRFDDEYRSADGVTRYLRVTLIPVRDNDGEIRRIIKMDVDITEERHAENVLRESEEMLRRFVRDAPVAIAMFDTRMRYLVASRRWMTDYHLGDGDITGLSHYEIFPEITPAIREIHRRGLAGETLCAGDRRFVRRDGSVQWISWEMRPWHTAEGSIGGIIIASSDITEQKKAEDALRESEEKFRRIFNSTRDAIHIIEIKENGMPGKFIEVNDAACTMVQYSREELLTMTPLDLITGPGSQSNEQIRDALHDNGQACFEVKRVRRDGTMVPVEITLRHTFLGKKEVAVAVVRDISERKRAEAALVEMERKLDVLFDNKSRKVVG